MADNASKLPTKTQGKVAEFTPFAGRSFQAFRQELDRLFDDFGFFGRMPNLIETSFARGLPAVDVAETDKAFEITVEMPGFAEKDIHVEIIAGELRIRGESKNEREEKRKDYYLAERRHGSFERRFRLPEGADADKIEAQFKNGLLAVTLPKTTDAQKPAKQIPVKTP